MSSDKNMMRTTTKVFASVLAMCTAPRALASCQNESLNYDGDYKTVYATASFSDGAVVGPNTGSFPTRIESIGNDIYAVTKASNATGLVTSSAETVGSTEVTSLCLARRFGTPGLECADVDDTGYMQLTPLRVDEDCNVIQLEKVYLEPFTNGCPPGDDKCRPNVGVGPWTRVGYSEDDVDAFPILTSSSVAGPSVALPLAVLSLGAAFLV
jgi:hypothetical protein